MEKDNDSHDKTLRNVLERGRKILSWKKKKCDIKIIEVVYIDEKITKDGVKHLDIEAILITADQEGCRAPTRHANLPK